MTHFSDTNLSELGCRASDTSARNRFVAFGIEAATQNPSQEEVIAASAISDICVGHYDAAMRELNELILRNSSLFPAMRARGLLYSLIGDFDRAIDDFSRAIALRPRSDVLFIDRAAVYNNMGDSTHAIADLNEAIRLNHRNIDAYITRGMFYAKARDLDRALADLDEAVRIAPHDPNALIDRGTTLQRKGDYAGALRDFDTAITSNPQNWVAYHDRCETRARMGEDLDKALADCNTDLAERPNNPLTLASRAFVYLRLARYDDAIADANTCISTNSQIAEAFFIRAVAKLRRGDTPGGNGDLTEATSRNPGVIAEFAAFGVTP